MEPLGERTRCRICSRLLLKSAPDQESRFTIQGEAPLTTYEQGWAHQKCVPAPSQESDA